MSQQSSPQGHMQDSFIGLFKGAIGFMGVIFLLIGGLALETGISSLHEGSDTKTWPGVSGIIIASSIDKTTHAYRRGVNNSASGGVSYTPVLVYDYQLGGTTYTGTVIYKSFAHALEFIAEKYIEQYSVGSSVTVYYNPENPEDTVLEPGFKIFSHYFAFTFFGGLFSLLGVIIIITAFRFGREFRIKPPQ